MSLRDLDEIKANYDSGLGDNILRDFYVPVLTQTIIYKRLAGFFSSTSLAIASRGIAQLVKNHGKMFMIVSPRLSVEDINAMEMASNSPEEVISRSMINDITDVEDTLRKKRVDALAWLIANEYLEMKVAVVYDDKGHLMTSDQIEESGLFHVKVGIMEDADGNIMTFSGSVNETASAWLRNVEEFKVFRNWVDGQRESAQADIAKFESYWTGESSRVRITNLPTAVKSKLVKQAPSDFSKLEVEILREEQEEAKKTKLSFEPFEYQIDALKIWKKNHRAIFEMATGTGKTKTAQICIADFFSCTQKSAVVFIICPQDTLVKQWLDDIKVSGLEWDNYVICDSTVYGWRDQLTLKLLDISVERAGKKERLFVYSTFDTFCGKDFIRIITENKIKSTYFFVGDEAHGLGSKERSKGLLDIYDYRLGLSATPDRWYDEAGTKLISNFFGADRYEFSLKMALNTINPLTGKTYLTPYDYLPIFTTLEDDEIARYVDLTRTITKYLHKSKRNDDYAERIERLRFLRADIHKSAENKLSIFESILNQLGDSISKTLVFVSPGQIDRVMEILNRRKIRAHRITNEQGKKPEDKYGGISEREHIIKAFKAGDYQVLVAMKIMDEGIDIPNAETGIILASSTNPREYIQRIGRIIRYFPGKEKAKLYDVIIEPSYDRLSPELAQIERQIFRKELDRIREISENANNRLEIINTVFEKML